MTTFQDIKLSSSRVTKSDRTDELVALFDIPLAVMERPASLSLRFAFQKFQAFESVQEEVRIRIADGTWVGKSPSKDDVIEIFISKSVWYNRFKHFDHVDPKSKLYLWLEGKAGAPSGLEVFGIKKDNYSWADLILAIQKQNTMGGKKKRKAQLVEEKESPKRKKKFVQMEVIGGKKGSTSKKESTGKKGSTSSKPTHSL